MRVLILRPDNIGDIILFSGALSYIRSIYKESHLTLAVQPHAINLVELCPYIDSCIPINALSKKTMRNYEKRPLSSKLRQPGRTLRRIWNSIRRPYEIVIYPVKTPHVTHLKTLYELNPKQIIGIIGCNLNAPKEGFPPDLLPEKLFTNYLDVSKENPWEHEFITNCNFINFIGKLSLKPSDIPPQFWLAAAEENYLQRIQNKGRKVIGLFPGSSYAKKNWPATHYGTLTQGLGEKYVYAIFGGSADKALSDQVEFVIKECNKEAEVINLTQ